MKKDIFTKFDDICGITEQMKRERKRAEDEENYMRAKEFKCKVFWVGITLFISIGIFCLIGKQVIDTSNYYKKHTEESSEFRLSMQKIDDGDIAYMVSPGKLHIYQKVIKYGRAKIGKIYGWQPYVDYQLIDEIPIPYREGKFNKEIWRLELQYENNNPNAPWYNKSVY